MKKKSLFSVLIVITVLLFNVAPVLATAPVHWTSDLSGTDVYSCGSFNIYDYWTIQMEGKNFYNNDGAFLRSWSQNAFTDHFSNPLNGKEVSGQGALSQFIYPDGTFTNHGLFYHVIVPGQGVVLIDAGYLAQAEPGGPFILHGNHQIFQDGDLNKLCTALQ